MEDSSTTQDNSNTNVVFKTVFDRIYTPKFLYSWGLNNFGQLAQSVEGKPCKLPKVIELSPEDEAIHPPNVKHIAIGLGNTFLVTNTGSVYGAGINNIHQLLTTEEFINPKFQKLNSLEDYVIESVSVLWESCYAITSTGIVLGWGSNAYGQLGKNPSYTFSSRIPVEIYSETQAIQVKAGQRHCVILTKKGRVLTCGDSKNGQLGRNCDIYEFGAKEVEHLRNVRQIAVGQHHNLALLKRQGEMKLYAWGWNIFGQCTDTPTMHNTPFEIKLTVPIEKGAIIKCGWTHSGILLVSGDLYSWGDNKFGQQGHERLQELELSPQQVKTLSNTRIKDFDMGFGHTIALLHTGVVIAWGDNTEGSCGIGSENSPISSCQEYCVGINRISIRVFAGYKQCFTLSS